MNILFDIGGSKTRVTVTAESEERGFLEPVIFDTPDTPEETARKVAEVAREQGEGFEGAFGGVSGVWDRERRVLHHSPNKPSWSGSPIRDILESALGVPVTVDNDADVVGLGEAVYGAGRGYSIVMYITISTGVGGGRIVDGRIARSVFGFEPGFQVINITDPDPYTRTLEGTISGTAFERRFEIKPYEVTDDEVWEEAAWQSAVGVYNSILHWSPDVVVLGGSMIVGDPAISVERISDHIKALGSHLPELPDIKRAELQSIGGIYGGLALSRTEGEE